MAIDPTGRILKQLPLNTRGFLDVRMRIPAMQSTYVQSGNAFAFILSGVLLGILLTPLWPVKGKRNDP
jgi:apolipoprotein N-acyltransferase